MNSRALRALKASIEHWGRLAIGDPDETGPGPSSCPLCRLYNNDNTPEEKACLKCPVYKRTHKRWCLETPYIDADYEWDKTIASNPYDRLEFRQAAMKEMRFLESLLPRRR